MNRFDFTSTPAPTIPQSGAFSISAFPKFETPINTDKPLVSSEGITPKVSDSGANRFDFTFNKPGFNLVNIVKDVAQSVARVGASVALTASQNYGGPGEIAVDPTAPKYQQNIQKVIFGDEPIQSYQNRISGATKTAEKLGLGKLSGVGAFAGVLGGDALNFLGGEFEADKFIANIAKETNVGKIITSLTEKGFAEDIAKTYAEKLATTTDRKIVEEAIAKATELQLGTKTSENLAKSLPESLNELAITIKNSGATKEEFISKISDALHGTESEAKQGAEKLIEEAKKSNLTLDEFYAKATGTEATHLAEQLPREIQATAQDLRQEIGVAQKESSSLSGSIPPEKPPVNMEDSVRQLTQALNDAKPVRGAQEAAYTAERSRRLAAIMQIREGSSGESGFYKELGALKGEYPKVEFDSLRSKIGQEHIDNLFNMVRDSQTLSEFDKISARSGLAKVFGKEGGAVPTNSELRLLSRVFPKEIIQTLLDKRPILTKIGEGIVNALNIPRAILASFDLSAPFRQGLALVHRKEFWTSFNDMFKAFGSEQGFKAVQQSIMKDSLFPLAEESKLALTGMDELISAREEQFMSNFAEKVPVVGRVVRASGRAYTAFLNKLRFDTFKTLVSQAELLGRNFNEDPKLGKDLAMYIGSATGRGNLGAFERAAPLMNAVMFSPRLMASRLNLLNPAYYVKLDPFVRKEALKSLLTFGAAATTVLGLASLGGAKVSTDPTNADFGKIRIGNTRMDILGGFQQYIRIAAQLVAGKITSSTTGKTLDLGVGYKPLTRLDILERFFQGKENPVASFITDFLQGQDVVGNKFDLKTEVVNRFIPLIIQDFKDTVAEQGVAKATGLTIPGIFGVGLQSYDSKKPSGSSSSNSSSGGNRFNF